MMIATHILVGHDGLRDAETAFEDILDPLAEVETQTAIELATRHHEELLDRLRRQAEERHVTFETHVLVGHPADQIPKAEARHGALMIVTGPRGRSAIRDWASGSPSRRVFTHATCPVPVVRAR